MGIAFSPLILFSDINTNTNSNLAEAKEKGNKQLART